MRKIYLYITYILLVFFSCNNSDSNNKDSNVSSFDKFPQELHLKSTPINTPPILHMVGEIELTDSILIAMDLKGDKFFHIFNLSDFVYQGSYINRGHGPNEEIVINPYFRHLEGNKFLYHNSIAVKIAKFELSPNRINIINNYNLPGTLMNLQSPFILDDQIIGWNPIVDGDREFLSYDPVSKKVIPFGAENLKINNEISVSKNKLIFAKIISVKPDKTLFAVVYDKFPILRIYDNYGMLLNESRFENGQIAPNALSKKNISKSEMDKITQDYRKIKTTNKYIYALYIGRKYGELTTKGAELDDFSNEIHVWDWKGNPITKIVLDRKIFSFVVTSNDKFLVCSSLGSIDKLYKYSLR